MHRCISFYFLSASVASNILSLYHLFHDFENFMSLFGRFQFLAPTCFLEVICPRYGPDTIIINWNMRNICTHSWCLLCMVFFPALAYTSHESHVMFSANIRYIYTSTCWITEEEVYFKSILFRQKKYIWSTFCEIKLVFLM